MICAIDMHGVTVQIVRDDENHDIVSGNKLHKLKPALEAAKAAGCTRLLSFGGPYSNHLHALAFSAQQAGLQSTGLIRGELHAKLTPCLEDCRRWGMQLHSLRREHYRELREQLRFSRSGKLLNPWCLSSILDLYGRTWVIPEGGSTQAAVDSLANAYKPLFALPQLQGVTHAVCATGTGATVAGLTLAAPTTAQVWGVQAVAEGEATLARIKQWLPATARTPSIKAGHLGGFAKQTDELRRFVADFERHHRVPLDPVYTAKVAYFIERSILDKSIRPSARVMLLHTGGLQGRRS